MKIKHVCVAGGLGTQWLSLSETGLVITSGEQATTFTPIVDGRILQDACAQLQVGGEHVTDQLFKVGSPVVFLLVSLNSSLDHFCVFCALVRMFR